MRFLAMITLLATGIAFAGGGAGGDLKKFQGAWQRLSIIDGGKKVEGAEKGVVVFKGNEYTLKDGDTVKGTGTFKLDESKNPKEFDIVPAAGAAKGKTLKGIYKFEGDQLIYCIAGLSLDRPKDFASPDGAKVRLYTNKRAK